MMKINYLHDPYEAADDVVYVPAVVEQLLDAVEQLLDAVELLLDAVEQLVYCSLHDDPYYCYT